MACLMRLSQTDELELELTADDIVAALLALGPARRACVLDSCGARAGDGARFLVAGFDPFETVEARGDELRVHARGEAAPRVLRGAALAFLDARLKELRVSPRAASGLPARGACVAAFSYDLAREFEKPRARAADAARASMTKAETDADAVFAFFDALVIHDYARGVTKLVGVGAATERLREIADTLRHAAADASRNERAPENDFLPERARVAPATNDGVASSIRADAAVAVSNFTRAAYVAAVERIREHIYAGDIYQANLTQRISCAPSADATPERVFLRLRREHPAAFAAFVRLRAGAIVSASPERFLRVGYEKTEGNSEASRLIEAWPIKGTRRRGRDRAEDARLCAELLASAKDRAENVMIVDLLRNDLGRVSRYGSIDVAELCALQEHPTLFHLVSKVRGRLRAGVTAGDILRATFPCGSITGAPKIRAMEIIDDIEPAPRGYSMGAIGYFSFDGALDLNVAIRTITFDGDGAARFNVGGGVVAESDPAAEYEESLLKARALLRALGAELKSE